LDQYAKDLTQLVREGQSPWPFRGRDAELVQLQRVLLRRTNRNPLVIGSAGVGKTALLLGLAASLLNSASFAHYRICELKPTSLIAGTYRRGDLESRVQRILEEISDNPEIILAVDGLHQLQTGRTETSANCAELFESGLAGGELCMIATTCPTNLDRLRREGTLVNRFEPVFIQPLSGMAVRQLLKTVLASLQSYYESRLGIELLMSDDLLEEIPALAHDTWPGRAEPDASITLLQHVLTAAAVPACETMTRIQVNSRTLATVADSLRKTATQLEHAKQKHRPVQSEHCPGDPPALRLP
jgi:ATP-dependent Clp protease ATP-binding subunit ClpA